MGLAHSGSRFSGPEWLAPAGMLTDLERPECPQIRSIRLLNPFPSGSFAGPCPKDAGLFVCTLKGFGFFKVIREFPSPYTLCGVISW